MTKIEAKVPTRRRTGGHGHTWACGRIRSATNRLVVAIGAMSVGCSTPARERQWNAEDIKGAVGTVWWRYPTAPEFGPRIEQLISKEPGDALMTTELSGVAYVYNTNIMRRLEGDTIVATKHELKEFFAGEEEISAYYRVTDPALAREFRELCAMVRVCAEWDGLPLAGTERNRVQRQFVAYVIAASHSSRPLMFSDERSSRSLCWVALEEPWTYDVGIHDRVGANATFPYRLDSESWGGLEPSIQQGIYWQIEWFDWRAMEVAQHP